jgi:hemin uptake protein HemP
MKQLKKDRILTIKNNPSNKMFFDAQAFFGDKGYLIIKHDGKEFFVVKHAHGVAYYELKGSFIGKYTNLF